MILLIGRNELGTWFVVMDFCASSSTTRVSERGRGTFDCLPMGYYELATMAPDISSIAEMSNLITQTWWTWTDWEENDPKRYPYAIPFEKYTPPWYARNQVAVSHRACRDWHILSVESYIAGWQGTYSSPYPRPHSVWKVRFRGRDLIRRPKS